MVLYEKILKNIGCLQVIKESENFFVVLFESRWFVDFIFFFTVGQ